jgi:hypothetical protein
MTNSPQSCSADIEALEAEVKRLGDELEAAEQRLTDAKIAICGVAIGDIVVRGGKRYRVTNIDVSWATSPPWLKGVQQLKDGSWGRWRSQPLRQLDQRAAGDRAMTNHTPDDAQETVMRAALREIANMSHNCRSVDIAKAALAAQPPAAPVIVEDDGSYEPIPPARSSAASALCCDGSRLRDITITVSCREKPDLGLRASKCSRATSEMNRRQRQRQTPRCASFLIYLAT